MDTHLNPVELLQLQVESGRVYLRNLGTQIMTLATLQGIVPDSPAWHAVRTLQAALPKEEPMSQNLVPNLGQPQAPYGATEAPAKLNAVPNIQTPPQQFQQPPPQQFQQPQFQAPPQQFQQQQLQAPPQQPAPQMALYAQPAQAPAPIAPHPIYASAAAAGAPPPAPVPAAALAPPMAPVGYAQPQQPGFNQVPGMTAPVVETPLVMNALPNVEGAAGVFMPSAALDPAARQAALQAQIEALSAQLAQASVKPKAPTYYTAGTRVDPVTRRHTSPTGRLYLHRMSPRSVGGQRGVAPAGALFAPTVDLRGLCLPVRDVPAGGSSVGYAVAALREVITAERTDTLLPGYLSPAYIQAGVRRFADGKDAGASVVEELAVLTTQGICPESFYPEAPIAEVMPVDPVCDAAARPWRLETIVQVELGAEAVANAKALLGGKHPLVVSFIVSPSFETPDRGVLSTADLDSGTILGVHAVLVVGYDDVGWIVRNCHGTAWGNQGYAIMPYGYERVWLEAWTATATV